MTNEHEYINELDLDTKEQQEVLEVVVVYVFPYRTIRSNKESKFMGDNTHSIIRISQDTPDFDDLHDSLDEFDKKKIDEEFGGDVFFKLYCNHESSSILQSESGSGGKNYYQNVLAVSGITFDNFYNSTDYQIDFCTIDEPFDEERYRAGEQQVFRVDAIRSLTKPDLQAILGKDAHTLDDGGIIKSVELENTSLSKQSLENHRYYFTRNTNFMYDPQTLDGEYGFELEVDSSAMFRNVLAKGNVVQLINGQPETDWENKEISQYGNISLKSDLNLVPNKISTRQLGNKTNMIFDWFNYDNVLPYWVVNQMSEPIELEDIVGTFEDYQDVEFNATIYARSEFIWNDEFWFINPVVIPLTNGVFAGDIQSITIGKDNFGHDISAWKSGTTTLGATGINVSVVKTSKQITYYFDVPSYTNDYNVVSIYDKLTIKVRAKAYLNSTGGSTLLFREDIKLIEDMILIGLGYNDNWSKIKIEENVRVGHSQMLLSSLVNQDLQSILNGMWANHLKQNSDLTKTSLRLSALRAITISLTNVLQLDWNIGESGVQLEKMYLPWYLEMASDINYYSNKKSFSTGGGIFETYLLPGAGYENNNAKFSNMTIRAKTQYFRKDFGSQINIDSSTVYNTPEFPTNTNLSSPIPLKTANLQFLPEAPEVLDNGEDPMSLYDISNVGQIRNIYYHAFDGIINDAFGKLFNAELRDIVPVRRGDQKRIEEFKFLPGFYKFDLKDVAKNNFVSAEGFFQYIEAEYPGYKIINKSNVVFEHEYIKVELEPKDYIRLEAPYGTGNKIGSFILPWMTSKLAEKLGVRDSIKTPNKIWFKEPYVKQIKTSLQDWTNAVETKGKNKFDNKGYELIRWIAKNVTLEFVGEEQSVYVYERRKIAFDRDEFRLFLSQYQISNSNTKIKFTDVYNNKIEQIDEILLKSIMNKNIRILTKGHAPFEIEMFSKDSDEIAQEQILIV